jgi:hypothetical protein
MVLEHGCDHKTCLANGKFNVRTTFSTFWFFVCEGLQCKEPIESQRCVFVMFYCFNVEGGVTCFC